MGQKRKNKLPQADDSMASPGPVASSFRGDGSLITAAGQALAGNEQRYDAFFKTSMDAILLTSPDGRICAANPAACRLFGMTENELTDMGRSGVVDVTDPNLPRMLAEREREGKVSGELRFIRKDGTKFLAEISSSLFNDSTGEVRTTMIIRDSTRWNKLLQALRESEARFRQIYEEGPYGMALIGSDLTFLMANRTFCRISGYSEPELKKLRFHDITHPEDVNLGLDAYRKLTDGEVDVFRTEKRYVRKDGRIIWASITVTSNRDKEGRHLYNLAIVEDITERKSTEENVRLPNNRLRLLIEAIQELSVSHDLRAPLRHINGFSEILLNKYTEELPGEDARYLGTIVGAAKQMGVLIDDLLALSRTGRAELRKTIVSMETVVNEALSTLSQQLEGREIEWQAESLPACYCDARLVRQVWINLIDNAVKYTRKLFGVFQRMHSSNDFEGTGVGLANVHRIITRHGGRIWADAKPDRGRYKKRLPGNPSVILLDLKMPRMDGLEVLREIKGDPDLKIIPIVMITSSREEKDLIQSYRLGVNAYVVKPVEYKRYLEAIRQVRDFWTVVNETP